MEIDRRKESFYANKAILAPMVRVGTLPMRLLALRYGADLVYSEEIIDFKLIKSRRSVNNELGTVDYIDESGFVVFRTCEEERDRLVIQIGTNDPERAVCAAKIVENDVAAIDINMGCPKSFSLKGGMGAALLSRPDLIHSILTSLKANIGRPISCKIRVLPDLDATIELVKIIEKTGVDAVAIHGRTKMERPQHPNRTHFIQAIATAVQIPVIANGGSSDIKCFEDIAKFKEATNASSVMIGRTAMKNFTIFDKSGKIVDIETLVQMYLKLSIEFDNNAMNAKYCVQQILGGLQDTEKGRKFLDSYELEAMSQLYDVHSFYLETMSKRRARKGALSEEIQTGGIEERDNSIVMPVIFDKRLFEMTTLPKSILNRYICKNDLEEPTIRTYQVEKQYHSQLSFMGRTYSSRFLEKTKRHAEQSAALVLLLSGTLPGLCNDAKVINKCLVSEHNAVDSLKISENGRTYLIKINK